MRLRGAGRRQRGGRVAPRLGPRETHGPPDAALFERPASGAAGASFHPASGCGDRCGRDGRAARDRPRRVGRTGPRRCARRRLRHCRGGRRYGVEPAVRDRGRADPGSGRRRGSATLCRGGTLPRAALSLAGRRRGPGSLGADPPGNLRPAARCNVDSRSPWRGRRNGFGKPGWRATTAARIAVGPQGRHRAAADAPLVCRAERPGGRLASRGAGGAGHLAARCGDSSWAGRATRARFGRDDYCLGTDGRGRGDCRRKPFAAGDRRHGGQCPLCPAAGDRVDRAGRGRGGLRGGRGRLRRAEDLPAG